MIISAIAAMGKNRSIGIDNKLPWRLPLELKMFKEITMGKYLVMGRKTFECRPPLPGRTSIVVTRNPNYQVPDGCFVSHSIEGAIELEKSKKEKEVFIIGGEQIFELALPCIEKLYLTEVDASPQADAFFPALDLSKWKLQSENTMGIGEKNPISWTARIYTKI